MVRFHRIDHVALHVKDVETSVRFYEGHFGFKTYFRAPTPTGIDIAYLKLGDTVLELTGHADPASGGYHFTVPADFNGGIFGGAVGNRLSFVARRDASGVSGRYNYEQTFQGETFVFKGSVTCFQVYDTPVLQNWPGIPAATANRAKWGGVIESSNDPTLPPGGFIWFQSIDNGEGADAPPDLSTLSGFGDEVANEAFCASANVPNPNFGPHAAEGGNIQVE